MSQLNVNLDVAKRLDITCRKGDTFELIVNATDSSGNSIDFSAYSSGVAQVRPTDDSSTLTLEFSSNDGSIAMINGAFRLSKSASDMSSVDSGTYVYDIQLVDGAGKSVTWFYGLFTINEDVSIGTGTPA